MVIFVASTQHNTTQHNRLLRDWRVLVNDDGNKIHSHLFGFQMESHIFLGKFQQTFTFWQTTRFLSLCWYVANQATFLQTDLNAIFQVESLTFVCALCVYARRVIKHSQVLMSRYVYKWTIDKTNAWPFAWTRARAADKINNKISSISLDSKK